MSQANAEVKITLADGPASLLSTKNKRIAELERENERLRILLAHNEARLPIRTRIALWLVDRKSGSPIEFQREHQDLSLGIVSYHFRVLHERGEITMTKTRPRRGATEHFYALKRNHRLRKI